MSSAGIWAYIEELIGNTLPSGQTHKQCLTLYVFYTKLDSIVVAHFIDCFLSCSLPLATQSTRWTKAWVYWKLYRICSKVLASVASRQTARHISGYSNIKIQINSERWYFNHPQHTGLCVCVVMINQITDVLHHNTHSYSLILHIHIITAINLTLRISGDFWSHKFTKTTAYDS